MRTCLVQNLLAAVAALSLLPCVAHAQVVNPMLPDGFQDQVVVSGFDQPTSFEFLPDLRIILTERRSGLIRLVVADTIHSSDPIGLIPNIQFANGEEGLLGLAVDPRWPAEPHIYLHYTSAETSLIFIERYTVTGDVGFTGDGSLSVDMASRHRVISASNTAPFHNGGTVIFGPDSMLYVALGDDGGNCDAMDPTILRGKILRLEVRSLPPGPGGPPLFADITPADNPFVAHADTAARLVHTLGLRNPFSLEIDPLTGDLFIADVGSVEYEELNWVPEPGRNYGWPHWEGPKRRFPMCAGVDTTMLVDPIAFHANSLNGGGTAIITAGAYRAPPGATDPWPAEYDGDVLYGDFGQDFMRRMSYDGFNWAHDPAPGQPDSINWAINEPWIADFEVGPDGSWWYLRMWADFFGQANAGYIGKLVFVPPASVEVPAPFGRFAAHPQPSSGAVTLRFALARPAQVSLAMVDLAGRVVRTLEPGRALPAGDHAFTWDGRDARGERVPPGVYFGRVRADDRMRSLRVVRLD